MRQKEIKKIMTLVVVSIFVFTSFSAIFVISTPSTQQSEVNNQVAVEISNNQSVIPSSEYNISLERNEEIIWMADNVSSSEQIAYVTGEFKNNPVPAGGILFSITFPSYKLEAYASDGVRIFWFQCSGFFIFRQPAKTLMAIIPWCKYNLLDFCHRFRGVQSTPSGVGTTEGRIDINATCTHYTVNSTLFGLIPIFTPIASYGIQAWVSSSIHETDGGGSFWLLDDKSDTHAVLEDSQQQHVEVTQDEKANSNPLSGDILGAYQLSSQCSVKAN